MTVDERSSRTGEAESWTCPVLEGPSVRLEPMAPEHEDGLWQASRDPRIWRWLPARQPRTRAQWHGYVERALAAAADGSEIPLVTIRATTIVGATRFLALRPEHRSVEIGKTWLAPSAWGSGVNAEAKLLQLRHAFEAWRCRRVELKTEALNERSRGAIEALGATFEGIHRNHMLVRGGESRDTAWYSILDEEWPRVEALLERRVRP